MAGLGLHPRGARPRPLSARAACHHALGANQNQMWSPDGENALLHICKNSGRGDAPLVDLKGKERPRRERSREESSKLCFSSPPPGSSGSAREPAESHKKGGSARPKRSHVSSQLFRCLQIFFKCPGPKLSNAPAGGHFPAEGEGGSSLRSAAWATRLSRSPCRVSHPTGQPRALHSYRLAQPSGGEELELAAGLMPGAGHLQLCASPWGPLFPPSPPGLCCPRGPLAPAHSPGQAAPCWQEPSLSPGCLSVSLVTRE